MCQVCLSLTWYFLNLWIVCFDDLQNYWMLFVSFLLLFRVVLTFRNPPHLTWPFYDVLTISDIILKNGQTYLTKEMNTARLWKCVWPFFSINNRFACLKNYWIVLIMSKMSVRKGKFYRRYDNCCPINFEGVRF